MSRPGRRRRMGNQGPTCDRIDNNTRVRPQGRRRSIRQTTAWRSPSERVRPGSGALPPLDSGRPCPLAEGSVTRLFRREPRQVYRVYDEDDFLADVEPEHGPRGLEGFSEVAPPAAERLGRGQSFAPRGRVARRLPARWVAAGVGGLLVGTLAVAGFRVISTLVAKREVGTGSAPAVPQRVATAVAEAHRGSRARVKGAPARRRRASVPAAERRHRPAPLVAATSRAVRGPGRGVGLPLQPSTVAEPVSTGRPYEGVEFGFER